VTRSLDDNGGIPTRVRLVHVTTAGLALGFLRGQVRYMKSRGLDVLAVSSPGDGVAAFQETEGVLVHPIPMLRRIAPSRDLVALARLFRYLRAVRPQIVHAHTPKGGLLGTTAAWLARVPVRIYHIRGLRFMTATGGRRALLRLTEKVSCTLAHHVLCVSPSVRDVAVQEGICSSRKLVVLGNGSGNGVDAAKRFDPARWTSVRAATRIAHGIPADALVVGFVGRVVRDKGITELVQSWQQLREQYCTLHLLLVGPFEPEDPLPDSVNEVLRSDGRIHLAGPQVDPAPFYAAMDLVVLPTYREGFPNVPLEAAAMALPVVATRIAGCIDAIRDGVTGTLVRPRDPVALADAIGAYLRQPELRDRHGRAGRHWVLNAFRPEAIWNAVYLEYVRLLEGADLVPSEGKANNVDTGSPGAVPPQTTGGCPPEPVAQLMSTRAVLIDFVDRDRSYR
jgi:glycosyltransferase involved in cell wall biosynthesis